MLVLPKNYSVLETCEFISTEKKDVIEIMSTCEQMVFIDTCIMARIYLKNRIEDIIKYLEVYYSDDLVVVFTETLLCELTPYASGGMISCRLVDIFKKLSKKYEGVLFKEEWLGDWRKSIVDEDDTEVNQRFKDTFKRYKALLPRIDAIADEPGQPFHKILYGMDCVDDNNNFISDVIFFIKSKKKKKDSLAELLVFLCALYMMDLYESDYEERAFCFFTADRKAGARVKVLQNHSDRFVRVFGFYTDVCIVSHIYESGLFADKDAAILFVKDVFDLSAANNTFKVSIYKPGMLEITEKELSPDDFIELIKSDSSLKVIY